MDVELQPTDHDYDHDHHRENSIFRRKARTGERVKLEWKDIYYSVLTGNGANLKEKVILHGMTGTAESGQLIAILGPTGSGKTSLLNILAGRCPNVSNSKLTGTILLNGSPRRNNVFKAISAYVQQDDVLFEHLTVKETLMLSAHFYLPSSLTKQQKDEMVEAVIMELGLVKAKDTIIGNTMERGVSGGERKRANIGVELISDPAVLFLDEPTSGLDSFQAQSVMEAMKSMVSNGRLVISVIHQPRSSIYAMFDQMLIISEGRTMFYGPASEATAYFAAQGHPCPPNYNPADFFLDLVSMDYRSKEAEEATRNRITILSNHWTSTGVTSALVPVQGGGWAARNAAAGGDEPTEANLPHLDFRSSWFVQFALLFWRSFNETRRNMMATGINFVMTIIFALILAGIYQDLGYDQKSIQDRSGLLYFVTINQCFGGMFGALVTFPNERKVVTRERAGKAYRMSAYYVAKFLAELPFNIGPPFLFGVIIYWAAGLNPDPVRFLVFIVIMILESLASLGLGLVVSVVSPNFEVANNIGPFVVIILMLFGGFYINLESLPAGSEWVTYISMLKWAFQAYAINEFKGEEFTCTASDHSCLKTGEEVLDSFSFGNDTVGEGLLGLFVVFLGYNLLAYVLLRVMRAKYTEVGYVGKNYSKLPAGATTSSF